MKQKKGFTLIELLVVIAIIAILAAILFPVFAKAREKARQATCVSNVRQISSSFNMYAQDYDENYPALPNYWGQTPPWIMWPTLVVPYTKNWDVFNCPDRPVTKNWDYQRVHYDVCPTYSTCSLLMNSTSGVTMASITKPADKFMLADSNHIGVEGPRGWLTECRNWTCNANALTTHVFTGVHSDGIVVCYFDGHVKWLNKNRVWNDGEVNTETRAFYPTE